MSGVLIVVLVFVALALVLGAVAYLTYQGKLRRAKAIERGLKMVPLLIHLPPQSSDTTAGGRDIKEVMREKTAQAEVLYNLIAGTATAGFKSSFYGQRHVALELVATDGLVHFYAAVPVNLVTVVEQAILTAYPGARLEEVEDHNIFSEKGRLSATVGGELVLKASAAYPIATYMNLDRDPLSGLMTTLSGLTKTDGAAVQIMLRPARPTWVKDATKLTLKLRKGRQQSLNFGVKDLAKAAVKAPTSAVPHDMVKGQANPGLTQLELTAIEQVEDKTKHPGFEVLIRIVVSAENAARSQQLIQSMATSFSLFERPGLNGFKFIPAVDVQGLVTAFIFRFFPPDMHDNILNSAELATLFHLPDSQFTPTMNVERQLSKQVDGPVSTAPTGLLFGYNEFRGVKKEIRLSENDRRRHSYILGQTGTGKSTMLENLVVQDMLSGNGFAFIDPHGESAEKLLSMIPKNRAEDVIYFNPADTEYPLGLNLFEYEDPKQKDFLVQESLSMLIKLYDPNGTGVIGPRFEQWYRNAALTLMADPNGATFIEIPKVFTDTEYLKEKFKYLKDPTVIDFWTKEMGQTSDYHKSEMLGYFVSKFGAFQQNEIMRNIIGQTKSAFSLRDIMDQKKILIVNLSKGQIGELNSKLLGMMFVIKFQAAAMGRADVPEDQRSDFCLYVDEFQNFSTDSFASILSEARKYRLNLIVANQFIAQLTPEIRDAVFGNIGTIIAHRMGPDDAEFMVKQFTPVFDAADLMNIPNYNSAVRLMIGGLPSQPFTMANLPALGTTNLELGAAIKQLSAAKFGMAKSVVEAEIGARLAGRAVVPGASVQLSPDRPAEVPAAVFPVAAAAQTPDQAPVQPALPATPMPSAAPEPVVTAPELAMPTAPAPAETSLPVSPPVPPAEPVVPTPADVVQPESVTAVPAPMAAPASIIQPDEADNVADPERTALGEALPTVAAPMAASSTSVEPAEPTLTAPPIGAPPIDLPTIVTPAADKATLSIHDITGGNRVTVPDVELIPAGAEPPAAAGSGVADAVADTPHEKPLPAYNPEADPMANVPLLGTPAPAVAAPETSAVPATSAPYDPTVDPNAGVPLETGGAVSTAAMGPEPEPLQAAPSAPETAPKGGDAADLSDDAELPIHFIDPSLEAVMSRPVDQPVAAAGAAVVEQPPVAPAVLAGTPPPIGAPPVELGSAVPVSPAAPQSEAVKVDPAEVVARTEATIDGLLGSPLLNNSTSPASTNGVAPSAPVEPVAANEAPVTASDSDRHRIDLETVTGDSPAPATGADTAVESPAVSGTAAVPPLADGVSRQPLPTPEQSPPDLPAPAAVAPDLAPEAVVPMTTGESEPPAPLVAETPAVELAPVVAPEPPVAPMAETPAEEPLVVPEAEPAAPPTGEAPAVEVPVATDVIPANTDNSPVAPEAEMLPEAESLAAVDDAAPVVEMHEAATATPVPSEVPPSAPDTLEAQPEEKPEAAASPEPAKGSSEQPTETHHGRHRMGSPKPAGPEPLTGKLILPTGNVPSNSPAQPAAKAPSELGQGEVYVDEAGNVTVGN